MNTAAAEILLHDDVLAFNCTYHECQHPARRYSAKAADGDHLFEGMVTLCDYHARMVNAQSEPHERAVLAELRKSGIMIW